jgi:hypothetical protein
MSNPSPPCTTRPRDARNSNTCCQNIASSTDLSHTQQEIKASLWGRILRNEPGIITNLIKPHLVDSTLVDAIERAMHENPELKAARDLLFRDVALENEMYMPMVSACVGNCGEASPEQLIGHAAPPYLYLQCSTQAQRWCSFVERRTGSNSEHRSDSVRIHSAQSISRHCWTCCLCSIAHHSCAKVRSR